MEISTIKERVRVILDHNEVTSGLESLEDVTTLSIDTMIEDQVIPGVTQVMLIAPREYLDWTNVTTGTKVSDVETGVTTMVITLPNFLRFGRVKLSTWSVSQSEYVGTESKEYLRQWGEFDGLKATATRPLVALSDASIWVNDRSSEKNMHAECFGAISSTTQVTYATYLKQPAIESESIAINDRLLEPCMYSIAALVAETLKDSEKANQLMQVMKNLLTPVELAEESNNQ